MHPHLDAYLDWLKSSGVRFTIPRELKREPDHHGALVVGREPVRPFPVPGLDPILEHRDVTAGLASDHATESVARALVLGSLVKPGDRFWDVGCGTGVLATVGALLGTRDVLALDVDPIALELAKGTAGEAGVSVRFGLGSLLEPVADGERADVIAANLPHKPVPPGVEFPLSQNGGAEGDALHGPFVDQVLPRVARGARIVFALHSLPHPRLLRRYQEAFDLTLVAWKRRFLRVGEYGAVQERFVARAREGTSLLLTEGARRFFLTAVWVAVRR